MWVCVITAPFIPYLVTRCSWWLTSLSCRFSPEKNLVVFVGYEAVWTADPVWTKTVVSLNAVLLNNQHHIRNLSAYNKDLNMVSKLSYIFINFPTLRAFPLNYYVTCSQIADSQGLHMWTDLTAGRNGIITELTAGLCYLSCGVAKFDKNCSAWGQHEINTRNKECISIRIFILKILLVHFSINNVLIMEKVYLKMQFAT
jgi:hypothetical protein